MATKTSPGTNRQNKCFMTNKASRFEDFKLNRQLLNAVADQGYQKPTPIQQEAIPAILAGHDVIGIAQTGTGKTAAYVLPLLYKIKYAQGSTARAIILAPGKELALQIYDNLQALSAYCDLRSVCLYGGIGPKTQIEQLREGVDIIISTPGRFLDLYRRGVLLTKTLKIFVLDEADKMMDMGFSPQIKEILEKIPRKRQNLLFSATFPQNVQRLSDEFLEFPKNIEITPQSTPAETIRHFYYKTPNLKTKINLLTFLLEDAKLSRVIIFTRTKDTANNIYRFIHRKYGDQVRVIHANKSQNSRINAFNDFKAGNIRILVSTDVSARGLDIAGVSHVINFDVPRIHEEYVHRIGRTGRAEKSGTAISFANEVEEWHLREIEKIINQKLAAEPLPSSIEIPPTDKEEQKQIAMEMDKLKRAKDPEFKGAFHQKKYPLKTKGKKRNFSHKRGKK